MTYTHSRSHIRRAISLRLMYGREQLRNHITASLVHIQGKLPRKLRVVRSLSLHFNLVLMGEEKESAAWAGFTSLKLELLRLHNGKENVAARFSRHKHFVLFSR